MDPKWVTKVIDLSFWGWFKAYVDVIEWDNEIVVQEDGAVEVDALKDVYDNTEIILKTISNLQRQIVGIANDQEKLIKLVMKSKWTAKN